MVWTICVARNDVAPELRFQRRVDGLQLVKPCYCRSSGATSYLTTQARQRRCALRMMMPPSLAPVAYLPVVSALAVQTGRHTEKTPATCFSQKSTSRRNQRVNDIAQVVYFDTYFDTFFMHFMAT